ncbi:MAG: histidine phosphatase family protein [Flavobacteriales bacterium]|nr:histidine phosphatase family protein [Flavobacteriales bacterium]
MNILLFKGYLNQAFKLIFLFILTLLATPTFATAYVKKEKTKKVIYLARHGKSDKKSGFGDFDRPLSERGKNDAVEMGKRLQKHNAQFDLVITSAAFRSKQTAELMSQKAPFTQDIVIHDSTLFRCSPSILINRIRGMNDSFNHIMLIAHNPAIASCAAYFQDKITIKDFPTCGIMAIEFKIEKWAEIPDVKGDVLFYVYPKKQ